MTHLFDTGYRTEPFRTLVMDAADSAVCSPKLFEALLPIATVLPEVLQ